MEGQSQRPVRRPLHSRQEVMVVSPGEVVVQNACVNSRCSLGLKPIGLSNGLKCGELRRMEEKKMTPRVGDQENEVDNSAIY